VGQTVTAGSVYLGRSSFIGQLFDPTNLIALSAPFSSVGEQVGMQITARLVCDDNTQIALAGTDVTWSTTGPLFVGAAGVAVGQPVYQNTAATATATRGTASGNLALTVIDDSPDNYGTYASDALPDTWQITHFSMNYSLAGPTVDADKDDQSNKLEYLASTTPTDPESRFRMRIEMVPGKAALRRIVFSPVVEKRTYVLESKLTLTDAVGWKPATPADQGENADEGYFIDEVSESTKFYRIQIAD
jgi:hypothetical protein